jgi:predicted Zn-dependent protease
LEEVSLVESFSQARLLRPLPGQRQRAFTEFPQYYNNMDRVSALSDILAQDPNNTFARYGLAMEYANSGQVDRALEEFEKLLSSNPDYAAGYFMAAQTLVKAGRAEEAKKKLVDGIAAAGRKRDAHAESEMQAMLQEISG